MQGGVGVGRVIEWRGVSWKGLGVDVGSCDMLGMLTCCLSTTTCGGREAIITPRFCLPASRDVVCTLHSVYSSFVELL